MSKEYNIKPKHGIGKTVYLIDKQSYSDTKPKVWKGTVSHIAIHVYDDESQPNPVVTYQVKIADSFTDNNVNYNELSLLTKSEAERRYEQYCNDLKIFDDTYLKVMLDKAQKLLKAYNK